MDCGDRVGLAATVDALWERAGRDGRLKGMTTRLLGRRARRLPLLLAAVALVPALAACGGQDSTIDPINVAMPETPAGSPSESSPAEPGTTPWSERIAMSSVDLVTIETSGGMCASATDDSDGSGQVEGSECRSVTTIAGDGSWKVVDQDGTRTGRLDFEDLTGLTGTLYATDATKHPKDEVSCASWVDGRDVTLTYASATEGKDVSVSSCEYDLSDVKLLDVVAGLTAA